ncbi:hypothetical protein [Nostoc sp. NMS9]|uniref:hypothetical protein n=1 Tax=Nostoc sp. NMS9 TaxID=2815393 RepID=UPI0025E6480C|nr:hypothetical protein [Nostoc sp. NMS9]MBN3942474.1 hypothetical protein [Nostoc sp. NMS9]
MQYTLTSFLKRQKNESEVKTVLHPSENRYSDRHRTLRGTMGTKGAEKVKL